jgi:hypothetical protein
MPGQASQCDAASEDGGQLKTTNMAFPGISFGQLKIPDDRERLRSAIEGSTYEAHRFGVSFSMDAIINQQKTPESRSMQRNATPSVDHSWFPELFALSFSVILFECCWAECFASGPLGARSKAVKRWPRLRPIGPSVGSVWYLTW